MTEDVLHFKLRLRSMYHIETLKPSCLSMFWWFFFFFIWIPIIRVDFQALFVVIVLDVTLKLKIMAHIFE